MIAERFGAPYCMECNKLSWPTPETAMGHVNRLKASRGVRKPDLLDVYQCPHRDTWHVGHNYKLKWISICIGEHK